MIFAEMTSPEIAALPRDIVVLIPVAACEQHSLHLPVYTDSMVAEQIGRRVHEQIPDDVLVLPVQWLGYSQHHVRYPGTVSATSETYLLMLMDMVVSMVNHGFTKILFLNSHGGNNAGLSVLLQRLMERYQEEEAEFYTRGAWAAVDKMEEIRDRHRGSGHAGETETSMILALRPELVHTDLLDPDREDPRTKVEGAGSYLRFDQLTAHGGNGDPTTATAEKGQCFFEVCSKEVAETVVAVRAARPFG